MILSKEKILIHAGEEIHILTPHEVNCNITTDNDSRLLYSGYGTTVLWSIVYIITSSNFSNNPE